jgi:hypothetical protein
MLFSSWLRNSNRSELAARRRTQTSSRGRTTFRPRPDALAQVAQLHGCRQREPWEISIGAHLKTPKVFTTKCDRGWQAAPVVPV